MKRLALLLFLLPYVAFGNPDSLLNVWESSAPDTSRIKAAYNLAAHYEFVNADSCLLFAEKAYELSLETERKDLQMLSLYYKGLGYYLFKDYDSCIANCERSLAISDALEDTVYQGFILYKLSRAYSKIGRYDLTIQTQFDAIRFYEARNYPVGLGVMYNNMSIAYKYLNEHHEAIKALRKAMRYYREAGMETSYYAPHLNMGDNYLQLKAYDSAMFHLDSAIWHSIAYREDSAVMVGFIKYWIGEVQFEQGQYEQALENFRASHAVREVEYDLDDRIYTLLGMGRALQKLGRNQEARPYLEDALEMSHRSNARKRKLMSHRALADLYYETGDFKRSAFHRKREVELRDSLFNDEKSMAIMSARTKFQVEGKDKEIEMLSMQNEMARREQEMAEKNERLKDAELKEAESRQMLLYGGLALAVVIVGGLVFVFRRAKKMYGVLAQQKAEIDESHKEITLQKEVLQEKNKEILDSISYAKRIQSAILPPEGLVRSYLTDSFILYKPKDIVAGDFYWMHPDGDELLFAAADCTGHGVPGAMVSVVCHNALNRSVREFGLKQPAAILDKTRELVIEEFQKSEEDVKDGMDISLCRLNLTTNELEWAGANNPLWIIRSNRHSGRPSGDPESADSKDTIPIKPIPDRASLVRDDGSFKLFEVKPDKQPIGKYASEQPFSNHTLSLSSGDRLFIFTDGYQDQFGGPKGKKFKAKNFQKLLLENISLNPSELHDLLDRSFETWKGDIEQIDDVCVIGVRV